MMAILNEMSWIILLAWVLLLVWAAAQVLWFRRLHVVPAPPPPRRRQAPHRGTKKSAATALPTGGTPEFLAELGLKNNDDEPA